VDAREPRELARRIPDLPRWVETRSTLLSGRAEVIGPGHDGHDGLVVINSDYGLVCVLGRPDAGDIRGAVSRLSGQRAVLSAPEDRDHVAEALPEYKPVRAILHLPGDDGLRLPDIPEDAVRLLEPGEASGSLERVPEDLARELRFAVRRSPVAAGLSGGAPVSFCYAAARTETLWDVSINTVEGFRRLGMAGMCVSYMAGLMRGAGLTPVWGAEEDHLGSLSLARKLGFVPVDEVTVFHPPHQAHQA
jgi:hypothetical protein